MSAQYRAPSVSSLPFLCDNDNANTFIEHKYSLQMRIIIHIMYDLPDIRCYVLYLCMETINGSE